MLLAALTLFIVFAPVANPLRNVVFDGYQRIFPLERESNPVAVVAIDEEALARYGQWPWPRTRVAELIARISDHQPAAIGLDPLRRPRTLLAPAARACLPRRVGD